MLGGRKSLGAAAKASVARATRVIKPLRGLLDSEETSYSEFLIGHGNLEMNTLLMNLGHRIAGIRHSSPRLQQP